MLKYNTSEYLPSAKDLPDSDDTPVDNQLQHLIPALLEAILAFVWAQRWDWFFGVDMGIYYDPNTAAIVPDGFLSLGVHRLIDEDLRLSYVIWEEKRVPILALEVVSQKRRKEYSNKKQKYTDLGILYYVVYNPMRRKKPRLEVYKLVNGVYELLGGEPVWLPEIGLGIGRERGTYQGITREWLYWYDESGQRYLTPEESAATAEQRRLEAEQRAATAEQRRLEAEQRAQKLAELLRNAGIDPDIHL